MQATRPSFPTCKARGEVLAQPRSSPLKQRLLSNNPFLNSPFAKDGSYRRSVSLFELFL